MNLNFPRFDRTPVSTAKSLPPEGKYANPPATTGASDAEAAVRNRNRLWPVRALRMLRFPSESVAKMRPPLTVGEERSIPWSLWFQICFPIAAYSTPAKAGASRVTALIPAEFSSAEFSAIALVRFWRWTRSGIIARRAGPMKENTAPMTMEAANKWYQVMFPLASGPTRPAGHRPLGAGRADVVLPHHVQHGRAGHPGYKGHVIEPQHGG